MAGSRPCVLDTAEGGAVRGGRSLAACLALDGDRPRWYTPPAETPAGKTEAGIAIENHLIEHIKICGCRNSFPATKCFKIIFF